MAAPVLVYGAVSRVPTAKVRISLRLNSTFIIRCIQLSPSGQWIAIIERGQCRFSEKIRHAIEANASAVIIYDNEPNKTPLFMHHDGELDGVVVVTFEF